jgi:hypothetical protein
VVTAPRAFVTAVCRPEASGDNACPFLLPVPQIAIESPLDDRLPAAGQLHGVVVARRAGDVAARAESRCAIRSGRQRACFQHTQPDRDQCRHRRQHPTIRVHLKTSLSDDAYKTR